MLHAPSAVYPELDGKVGSRLPDYRGYFLRGVGGKSAALGQSQGDAMQRITGGIRTASQKTDEVGENIWGAYYVASMGRGCNVYRTGDNAWAYKDTVFDSGRVVRTADETRPMNRTFATSSERGDLPNTSKLLILKHKRDGKCW